MIRITEDIWIGCSSDEKRANLAALKIGAVLNVAADLQGTRVYDEEVEYTQVGLVDGPGNEVSDYCAAALCLKMLLRRCGKVLVCDHVGGRSLVVALAYLNLVGGQVRPDPMAWSHWPTWEERLKVISETIPIDLPSVHAAHIKLFDRIPWGWLETL